MRGSMKIKKITDQHRRDFNAILICEHCDSTQDVRGYDDTNYHENVIPTIECDNCGKVSPDSYQPRQTKYPDGMSV